MKSVNYTFQILARWVLVMGTLSSIVAYIVWTLTSKNFAAHESQLHPMALTERILSQFGQAQLPSEWNIPLLSVAVWCVWLTGVWGTGFLISRTHFTKQSEVTLSERTVLQFGIGFVAYSMIQLGIGLVGFTRIPLIPVFFVTGLSAFVIPSTRSHAMEQLHAVQWQWKRINTPRRLMIIIFGILLATMVVPALTPPAQSDGVRYHLGAPQEYLKAGTIGYLPHNAYSNMPFLVEMHFLGALACKAPEASQLIHFTLALMSALAIYCLARRLSFANSKTSSAWLPLLPAILYLGTPMSAVLATWPFTDHGISFFLLASIIAALMCQTSSSNKRNYIIMGTMAGGLMGTKYTMAPIACVVLLIPLFNNHKQFSLKCRIVLTAAVVTAIIGGTWYLKNLVFTGNPFYPLASKWFPGNGEWTPANNQFLTSRAGLKGFGHSLDVLLGFPIKTTFQWLNFEAHNPAATILLSTIAVTAALLAGGATILSGRRLPLIALTALGVLIWFYSYQSNRLLLPLLALALGLTPLEILTGNSFARKIYSSAMLLSAACGFTWAIQWSWVSTGLTPPPLPYLIGAQDQNTFTYKSLTYARAFDFLNTRVPKSEKVLLIGEHRIYGANFNAIWSDWFDTPVLAVILRKNKLQTKDELVSYLRQTNTPWLLINERELEPQMERDFRPWFTPAEWNIFQELQTLKGPGIETFNLPPGVTIIHLKPHK